MSTRSVIARRMGDGFEGVYHHFDGYPSGLGCYLFRLVRHGYRGDEERFLDYALAHGAGWSHIFASTVRIGREGYGKPAPQCYCHGYLAKESGTKPGDKSGWQTWEAHNWDIE